MRVNIVVNTGIETLVTKQCGTCGIWFAVPDWHEKGSPEKRSEGRLVLPEWTLASLYPEPGRKR